MSLGAQLRLMPPILGEDRPLEIRSRRYLGAKTRLLDMLEQVVLQECGRPRSFADLFGGTGVVADRFNAPDVQIIANDTLRCNVVAMRCFLETSRVDMGRMSRLIAHLNALPADEENYFSTHFGGTYFTSENARRIGAIRECIAQWEASGFIRDDEAAVLLTSLVYATDRAANTCGHYDAYRVRMDSTRHLRLRVPAIRQDANVGNLVFERDANMLVDQIEADVIYLDPPYNSRQYSDTYHLLENLVRWEKPPVFGKARKMNRTALKSAYCSRRAPRAFQDLVARARCRHLVVSYNNMGDKGDARSNACIPDEVIVGALEARGPTRCHEIPFNHFTAGKRRIEAHVERIFVCRVVR